MRNGNLILASGIMAVILAAIFLALPDRPLQLDAMTLNHVGGGRFWLRNNTAKTLVIQLWHIETKAGTNWTAWGTLNHQVDLEPFSGIFDTILPANLVRPTNTWRLRGIVGQKLDGVAEVKTALRYYPEIIFYRIKAGDTNVSLRPFPKGESWYGRHRELLSATVSEN